MGSPQTIAHYRVTAKLGEGGMGEVWRATDTKLHRDVAIKTLPERFIADPDRLARFTREALVLASLNHPNIAAIYGVEDAALVLELVEGPTLAEKIDSRALTIEDSLAIAAQIAEALEYAHERGVVHRDLKPANIKITPNGRVKVLDFGLAKAISGDTASTSPTSSPTLTIGVSQVGGIAGTAAYMSPEQARGQEVDKRTDIWAFGAVLYEMLTGARLFAGETVSDTLAAVLRADFDWNALPAETPASVRRILRRCLERDRRRRLRDIGDALIDINEAGSEQMTAPPPGAVRPPRRLWFVSAVGGIFLIAALTFGTLYWRVPAPDRRAVQFDIGPPEGTTLGSTYNSNFAISPDGRKIVFAAEAKDGHAQLYLRPLEAQTAVSLPGTNEAFLGSGQPLGRILRERQADENRHRGRQRAAVNL